MWVDGYWRGQLRDGYPPSYFSNGHFEYPWQKDMPAPKLIELTEKDFEYAVDSTGSA